MLVLEIAYALLGRDIQISAQLITGLLVIGQRDILNLGKVNGRRTGRHAEGLFSVNNNHNKAAGFERRLEV